MKKTSTGKVLNKKTQTVIADKSSQDISRREVLIKAGRIVAGTVGGFALISLANINSVLGQDVATQKSIKKTLRENFTNEDVKTILASQQPNDSSSCSCYCNCTCGCTVENGAYANTGPTASSNPTSNSSNAGTYNAPVVPGVGLGLLALGLGMAGAWRILKDRAAQANKS